MLRNLLAIIVATIAGLAIAKFIEGALGGGVDPGAGADPREQVALVAGYLLGAFSAALIAMVAGRRWAALGWLGAATVFFAAAITLITFKLPLLLWPASAAACAFGGWAGVRLLKAPMAYPHDKRETLFD